MNYQVYAPDGLLTPFIKCFWSLESEITDQLVKQRVLPDGCIEMVFHYGDRYQQFFEDQSAILQPKSFVFGQISKFIEIAPTGTTGVLSARFQPDGFSPFVTIPISQLDNRACPLDEIFGEAGTALSNAVLGATDNAERIRIIEKFFIGRLLKFQTLDHITKSCVDVILSSNGQIAVNELADKMYTTRRNMERKFISLIGMSPKQLARVIRLQATLKMLSGNHFTSLTSLALENGYYDQAHFIKDFKDFTGLSPRAFYSDNLQFASLFATED